MRAKSRIPCYANVPGPHAMRAYQDDEIHSTAPTVYKVGDTWDTSLLIGQA